MSSSYYHYKEPVLDWSVFYVVTAVSSYIGVVVLALCVASGMFYLAELAEEYTTAAKRYLKAALISAASLHLLILVVDQLCWWRSLISIISNVAYYQLLGTFPWVKLTSPVCSAAIVCFVVDNASWYSYFVVQSSEFPFWSIVSYFVALVWLVPVGFFVSLAVSDERLPAFGSGKGDIGLDNGARKKRTFASLMGFLTGKKDNF